MQTTGFERFCEGVRWSSLNSQHGCVRLHEYNKVGQGLSPYVYLGLGGMKGCLGPVFRVTRGVTDPRASCGLDCLGHQPSQSNLIGS